MQLHEIGERDVKVRLHQDVANWLITNVRNVNARNELILGFRNWVNDGSFSINTGRIDHSFGGQASRSLRKAIRESPHIAQVEKGKQGIRSASYRFTNLDGIETSEKRPTERYPTTTWIPPSIIIQSSSLDRFSIDGDWLRLRADRWSRWCVSRDLTPSVDYFGLESSTQHVFRSLQEIRFPKSTSWLSEVAPRTGDRWLREAMWLYHRVSAFGSILRRVKYLNGRMYHWITTCPRVLRRLLTIGGERLSEADIGASYFSILVGQMPAGDERRRLIDLLTSGRWYEWLSSFGHVDDAGNPDSIKVEAQRQLLFGRDWRVSSRPLWDAMTTRFPGFGQLIESTRRNHGGASGFAHHLSRQEGHVMRPAFDWLCSTGVSALPLHDGILVGESSVELAAQAIRDSSQRVLGYTPLVRTK